MVLLPVVLLYYRGELDIYMIAEMFLGSLTTLH